MSSFNAFTKNLNLVNFSCLSKRCSKQPKQPLKIKKVVFTIKECDTDKCIEITLSNIAYQKDHNFLYKISETIKELHNLCKNRCMNFMIINTIDNTCLNRSKLHLSKSGTFYS